MAISDAVPQPRTTIQTGGLLIGGAAFLLMRMTAPPETLSFDAWVVAALAVLMIIWWVTEAVPIAATALAPMAILPFFGVLPLKVASAQYMSPVIVLLMAGFIIARAIERWGLHERIALFVVDNVGTRPPALIAGFMLSAAILSMWISNTATALMMTPIALSVASAVLGGRSLGAPFTTALLLSVAYACSIGGLATPVGSPTNLIVIGYLAEQGVEVSFAQWMLYGLPVVLILLPLAWFVLTAYGTFNSKRDDAPDPSLVKTTVKNARAELGKMTAPEKRTLIVFALVAFSWIFRSQLQKIGALQGLNDQIIAVMGAILLFVVPSGHSESRSAPLLDWQTAERIPWGVVLLFGGGLSLAAAISASGLAAFLAGFFTGLSGIPVFLALLAVTILVLTLTEFTSNVATVSALLPMVGAMAIATGMDLYVLALPLGLAASCAFMLPMATGPNAVAYGSGRVSIPRMASIGIWVNICSALVIAGVVYFLR
ncbi:SLC13 family permease [Hyphococcus lacteus]|uniref:DASS family sodium-coupled anion symporter n=1 Tax=Hyphococcus lacteus TaxID=3143536 RepID=A0ABV3Z4L2_9PROT